MCYATGLYLPSFIHYSSSWSISWSYEHGCCNCGDAIKSGDNHYLVSWYSEVWQGYTTTHVEHLSALLQIQCCYLHCVLWFERTQDSALGSRWSQHNVYSLSSCLLPWCLSQSLSTVTPPISNTYNFIVFTSVVLMQEFTPLEQLKNAYCFALLCTTLQSCCMYGTSCTAWPTSPDNIAVQVHEFLAYQFIQLNFFLYLAARSSEYGKHYCHTRNIHLKLLLTECTCGVQPFRHVSYC